MTFVLQTALSQGGDFSGEQKMYMKKKKKWVIYKTFVRNSFAQLKHNVVSQILLKINKASSYLANEVKIRGGGGGDMERV